MKLKNLKYNNLNFNLDFPKIKVSLNSVLVIGGAGSIGSNYIKQLIKFKPKRIVVVDINENGLTELTRDLRSSNLLDYKAEYITYPVNLLSDTFDKIFNSDNWDVVANFSAHKHVRSEKDKFSVEALIKNNVFGAIKLLNLCSERPPKYFFSVSTDKAANPINLYGATKLASDKIFIAANNITGSQKTIFSVVRYGNVAGSRGSVIPYFQKLINDKKKYLPITHEDMTRFWITLEQAIDFVFMSFRNMIGGEIFVPKIPSVKIVDLAKAMAPNLKTKIVGIRPGEKIHELMCPNEHYHLTIEFKKYFKIIPSPDSLNSKKNFLIDNFGERGKKVSSDFEYSSGLNDNFLSINQIDKINKTL